MPDDVETEHQRQHCDHQFHNPIGAAAAQLSNWYGIPNNLVTGISDSKVPDAQAAYEKALTTLPEEQRDVFLLHEEAGLNLKQIAEVTGVNRETAKSRLRYAVNKLKAAIDAPEAREAS